MFLLSYNREKWDWKKDGWENYITQLQTKEYADFSYNCRSALPHYGDKFFIVRVGTRNNGIFCSGIVDSLVKNVPAPFDDTKKTNKLIGKIKVLLDPDNETILGVKELKDKFPQQKSWEPQQNGIMINKAIQEEFESLWVDFVQTKKQYRGLKRSILKVIANKCCLPTEKGTVKPGMHA